MKRVIFILFLSLLVFSACSLFESPYKKGVYEGNGMGFGKDGKGIKLSVSIDEKGKILEVKILDHGESKDIGGKALDELVEKTLNAGDETTDTVSHATETSKGYAEALKDALEKAKNK